MYEPMEHQIAEFTVIVKFIGLKIVRTNVIALF